MSSSSTWHAITASTENICSTWNLDIHANVGLGCIVKDIWTLHFRLAFHTNFELLNELENPPLTIEKKISSIYPSIHITPFFQTSSHPFILILSWQHLLPPCHFPNAWHMVNMTLIICVQLPECASSFSVTYGITLIILQNSVDSENLNHHSCLQLVEWKTELNEMPDASANWIILSVFLVLHAKTVY